VSPKSKVRKKPPKHRSADPRARQAAAEAAQASRRTWVRVAVVVLVVLTVFGLLFTVLSGGDGGDEGADTASGNCPEVDGSSPRTTSFAAPPPVCISSSKTYVADMQTSKGLITITLNAQSAPRTVNNFVVLARYHYFDTQVFHRIIPGFVVQGGSPDGSGNGNPGYQFADELPQAGAYKVGSLAMANSGPDTNGSQFFIIVGDQGVGLPPNYSLFGQVTGGIDVAHAIEAVGTGSGEPTEMVTIQTVTIKET